LQNKNLRLVAEYPTPHGLLELQIAIDHSRAVVNGYRKIERSLAEAEI
jgi:hypothetical protein